MKPTPNGWPRLSAALFYKDAKAAIDWLCRAFDLNVRVKVEGPDGAIQHSELVYGEAVVMVAGEARARHHASPRTLEGANTGSLFLYVDDIDAHCARAREAGGRILAEPKVSDYGAEYWADKGYEVEDLEGHRWYFAQRIRG